MKNPYELSDLMTTYLKSNNLNNLCVENTMVCGTGFEQDRPNEKYHIFVDIFSNKKLSEVDKSKIKEQVLQGTPITYEGEVYKVVLRKFRNDLPRLI